MILQVLSCKESFKNKKECLCLKYEKIFGLITKKETINQMNYLPFLRVIPDHLRTFFLFYLLLSINGRCFLLFSISIHVLVVFPSFSTQLTSLILHLIKIKNNVMIYRCSSHFFQSTFHKTKH